MKDLISHDLEERIEERQSMVDKQLVARGISNEDVLESMRNVPRHLFVPFEKQELAYFDNAMEIKEGQTISQPYIVAFMIQALKIDKESRVLEIGTGSGYSAAVLSRMVSEVYTVERFDSLSKEAGELFHQLGYKNIHVRVDDGTKGWPDAAPFDGIIVTAAGPKIPRALCEQLVPGGSIVMPIGEKEQQILMRVRRDLYGELIQEKLCDVKFVPLIGQAAWKH